jgi:hypothetical protein
VPALHAKFVILMSQFIEGVAAELHDAPPRPTFKIDILFIS